MAVLPQPGEVGLNSLAVSDEDVLELGVPEGSFSVDCGKDGSG